MNGSIQSKTINAIVPDGKAIMLTYTYSVKGVICYRSIMIQNPKFNVSNAVSTGRC